MLDLSIQENDFDICDVCDNNCYECPYRNDCGSSTIADSPRANYSYCSFDLPDVEDNDLPF